MIVADFPGAGMFDQSQRHSSQDVLVWGYLRSQRPAEIMQVRVETYEGHGGVEMLRRFYLDGREIEVIKILD